MEDIIEEEFFDDNIDIEIEFMDYLCADSKNFGKEEMEAEERIISKNSISVKNNFFDYYK